MKTKMKKMTQKVLIASIIKIISIITIFCTIFSVSAFATQEYLCTLLLIPDKTVEYTDYDSGYLKIMNTKTGKVYNYTLYPYNNFSNKVMIGEGTYLILEAGINGRNDLIFQTDSKEVVVNGSVAFIANFGDSKIITPPTTEKVTEALSTKIETTTEERTEVVIPTLINPNTPTISMDVTEEETTEITEEVATTSEKDDNNDIKKSLDRIAIVAMTASGIVLAIGVIVFVIVKKKNKEEE